MATRKAAADKAPAYPFPSVCCDHQRRTCLLVGLDQVDATYIPFAIDGFDVVQADAKDFMARYHPLPDYPPDRCAQLYANYAHDLGATEAAIEQFSRFISISPQEKLMATQKRAAVTAAKAAVEPTKARKTAKAANPATKTAKPTAKAPKPAAEGGRRPSAAQRFQDLIMEGKLTDDQIFETVQKEFGLDEKKRGYVKWYRNYLVKQGKTPPAAK